VAALNSTDSSIARALQALEQGDVIAFPTDTVYALACRADRREAIARFYELKQRPPDQPSILLAHSVDALQHWVSFDQRALQYAADFWPGPLTLVLPLDEMALLNQSDDVHTSLESIAADGTIGVRVPDHETAAAILEGWGMPLCTSSANRAGERPPTKGRDVVERFGDAIEVVVDGESPLGKASSILDLTRPEPALLREGIIPATRLLR
jgi:L-threonylcarbamoyladenylate synthase